MGQTSFKNMSKRDIILTIGGIRVLSEHGGVHMNLESKIPKALIELLTREKYNPMKMDMDKMDELTTNPEFVKELSEFENLVLFKQFFMDISHHNECLSLETNALHWKLVYKLGKYYCNKLVLEEEI